MLCTIGWNDRLLPEELLLTEETREAERGGALLGLQENTLSSVSTSYDLVNKTEDQSARTSQLENSTACHRVPVYYIRFHLVGPPRPSRASRPSILPSAAATQEVVRLSRRRLSRSIRLSRLPASIIRKL